MARFHYMKIASDASTVVDNIMDKLKGYPLSTEILADLLYLYNLGIRTAPRAVQSTVRLNAVREAAKNQPATIRMIEKQSDNPRYPTYKAIQISTAPETHKEDGDTDEE
jgi:hypothetical protein